MYRTLLLSFSAIALAAMPASARAPGDADQAPEAAKPVETANPEDVRSQQPGRPVTQRDPNAMDVATTPMSDLNLRSHEIPKLLIDAQTATYNMQGLTRCSQIAAQVGEFDAVLGDDFDLPQTAGRRVSPGRVAQSVIGSFIPFRGVVREVSGANDQQRRLDAAIAAGLARRAFLKGVGQERGCRYPARSATREVWDQRVAESRKPAKPADKHEVADAAHK